MKAAFRTFSSLALLVITMSSVALAQAAPQKPVEHGIQVQNMDPSVRPGNEFYEYANGAYLKRIEIPPDRASIGIFDKLNDLASKRTSDLIAEIAKSNPAAGTETRKIADLYNSFMDEAGIEKRGLDPIRPRLDAIRAIRDKKDLARALGETLRSDVDPLNNTNYHTSNLFGLWVAPGFQDYERYNAYLLQGGLALPDREYYLSDSAQMREVRTKYQAYVATMMNLAGYDNPEQRATRIVELEHAIAAKHRSLEENQDILKSNNTWTQADFTAKAPGLDWSEYFRAAGLSKQKNFIVWQPEAFTGEAALVASMPLDSWKDWLAFHLLNQYGSALPKALADARFDMYGKTLSGVSQQRPRWERGVFLVNGLLGDAVGKIYAERYFSPQAKATLQQMVSNITEAFRKRIDALPWMAASTKAEAKAKLDTLYVGVGYPEKYRDYSKYDVKAGDLFGNRWRADTYEYQYQIARLGSAVDRHEWSMTPQTVNAVNLPLQNALNFPAAILEPPFFDPQAPAAANYGAIGATIGHEISHTFDTQGSTFDSKGRLRNWWTDADLEHFKQATQALARQYSTYKPFPDLALNGQQTLGENIADVAGLAASYDAFHASLQGKTAPEQEGFTPDQQFFVAFAQSWAEKNREAALRQQIATDPHSPGEYRADTVRNLDSWYAAFEVKPSEKLYLAPDARVRVW